MLFFFFPQVSLSGFRIEFSCVLLQVHPLRSLSLLPRARAARECTAAEAPGRCHGDHSNLAHVWRSLDWRPVGYQCRCVLTSTAFPFPFCFAVQRSVPDRDTTKLNAVALFNLESHLVTFRVHPGNSSYFGKGDMWSMLAVTVFNQFNSCILF